MNRVALEGKVLSENDRLAAGLRERFRENGVLCLNLISSPGSGKTSLLEKTLENLPLNGRMAILTGDIQTDNDAARLRGYGCPVKQIITGGTCHLDARMIEHHLANWDLTNFDYLMIENVGNLVCPSSYDLGEAAKIVMLSVTEGDDKPLKYPSIFFKSELMILSKYDLLPYVSFDADYAIQNARTVHPDIEVIKLTCEPRGIRQKLWFDQWTAWLVRRRRVFLDSETDAFKLNLGVDR